MARIGIVLLLASLACGCAAGYGSSSGAGSGASQTGQTPTRVPTDTTGAEAARKAVTGAKVHRLASGLVYEDLVIGNGKMADPGLNVLVHYTGWLADGTKFQSSLDRGQPYPFVLGAGTVIAGWDEGIKGMRVGGKRKLTIPPDLAYGEKGSNGVIPPNATLVFEVELVGVK